ncbi:MAG: SEC-C metal-binding domain-containing protein [Acidimicrobiales bacterium]
MIGEASAITAERIRTAAHSLLVVRGSLPLAELVDALDLGPAEAVVDALLDAEDLFGLDDDTWLHVPSLTEGVCCTHRLSALEADAGELTLGLDVAAVALAVEAGSAALAGGGELVLELGSPFGGGDGDAAERDRLTGPAGWLQGVASGDAIALTVASPSAPGAAVTLTRPAGPRPAPAPAAVAAVQAAFERLCTGAPVEVEQLAAAALLFDRAPFTGSPGAPLCEVAAAAGFELDGGFAAPRGFDWPTHRLALRVEQAAFVHGLDEAGIAAFEALISLHGAFAADQRGVAARLDPADRAQLCGLLSGPRVAPAFIGDTLQVGEDRDGVVGAFVELLLDGRRPRRGDAGALWLRSVMAERAGRLAEAEQHLDEALAAAPGFPPALEDKAWYESDRGELRRALAHLRRAGIEADDERVALLESLAASQPASAKRNEPCPCGSGRKFKQCHEGRESLSLARRAGWLARKANQYLTRGPHRPLLLEVARAYLGTSQVGLEAVQVALHDSVVADLALCEGGVWQAFLAERGPLLPADERELARQWSAAPRAVFEVRSASAEETVLVRLDGGVEVRAPGGLAGCRAGAALCVRMGELEGTAAALGAATALPLERAGELQAALAEGPPPAALAALLGELSRSA